MENLDWTVSVTSRSSARLGCRVFFCALPTFGLGEDFPRTTNRAVLAARGRFGRE